jgi:hypothetical protein
MCISLLDFDTQAVYLEPIEICLKIFLSFIGFKIILERMVFYLLEIFVRVCYSGLLFVGRFFKL